MRVISQDGTIDVPYEISSLSMAVGKYENVEHAAIFCHNSSTAMGTKMAGYSSKEKAKKAMEMLRIAYTGSIALFQNIEPAEEVSEVFKNAICRSYVQVLTIDRRKLNLRIIRIFISSFRQRKNWSSL